MKRDSDEHQTRSEPETFEVMALRIASTTFAPPVHSRQVTNFATRLRDEWMKGKVLVPREPTEVMMHAAFHAGDETTIPSHFYERLWHWYTAMIAAAEKEPP